MSGAGESTGRGSRKAAWILWLIASVLAFSAWTIDYVKDGRFRWPSLVLGLMCLILTLVSLRSGRR